MHQIEDEDVREIAKIFENEAQMPREIHNLPIELNLSRKARTTLTENTSLDIFKKTVDLLDIFVSEKKMNATYEELIRALEDRTMNAAAALVAEILNRKIAAKKTQCNIHLNQLSSFRNIRIDEEKFTNQQETRFGHQIEYDDIPELVKIFEDDPLIMVNEIDVLIHVLELSQASKSNLALTIFPNIYVKWLRILELWVGENGEDATYEKLIHGLRQRKLMVVCEKVEKLMKKKRTD